MFRVFAANHFYRPDHFNPSSKHIFGSTLRFLTGLPFETVCRIIMVWPFDHFRPFLDAGVRVIF
jgi:hypothetical protein